MNPKVLAPFGGTTPIVVSDGDAVRAWCEARGLAAYGELDALSLDPARFPAIFIIGCDYDDIDLGGIRSHFIESRMLWAPFASFDPSPTVCAYNMELLLACDFEQACARNREWMRFYADNDGPFTVEGVNTDLTCDVSDPLLVSTRTESLLEFGEWESIGAYFEMNCEAEYEQQVVFNVSGQFGARAMLAARHRTLAMPTVNDQHEKANKFLADLPKEAEIILTIEDSLLLECTVEGESIVDFLVDLAGPVTYNRVTEFAIGTNLEVRPLVDWRLNSQLNEGAGGVHVGIGEGATGVHIDFINPDATVRVGASDQRPTSG